MTNENKKPDHIERDLELVAQPDEHAAFGAWRDRFPEISENERLREAWNDARATAPQAGATLTDEQIFDVLKSILYPDAVRLPAGWLRFARALLAAAQGGGQ